MKVQCGKYELLDSIFVTQVEGKPAQRKFLVGKF